MQLTQSRPLAWQARVAECDGNLLLPPSSTCSGGGRVSSAAESPAAVDLTWPTRCDGIEGGRPRTGQPICARLKLQTDATKRDCACVAAPGDAALMKTIHREHAPLVALRFSGMRTLRHIL